MEQFKFYVFEVIVDNQTRWATSKDTLEDLYNHLISYKNYDDESYSLQYWTTEDNVFYLIESSNLIDIVNYCFKYKLK